MGEGIAAGVLGLGAGAWVYGRLMKTTNSPHSSLAGGAVSGVVTFIVILTLLKYVLHY